MRVLVATDHSDFGHALTLFLSERHIDVLDVVADAETLRERSRVGLPDVVLVDWRLGEAVSAQIVVDLMDRDDPTPVVILSTVRDRAQAGACGAAACATLGDRPEELIATLDEVRRDLERGAPR
jgi:DNA-binding response OmpR family regulator